LHRNYLSKMSLSEKSKLLANYSKALAHPARVEIIKLLVKQKVSTFQDFEKIIPLAQSTISQHLKELKNANLLITVDQGLSVKYLLDEDEWKKYQKLLKKFF